ncbi:MAG: phage tail tape measure protein [Xanthomonadaceae bacterium]|nr:phage tail tape measure protein [Xanthomonadaceae bacterium]
MASDLLLKARLTLDPQQWGSGLRSAGGSLKSFTGMARREVGALRDFMNSTAGRLTSLAGGVSAANELMRSARMDKSLGQIGLNAGATDKQVSALRSSLFGMAKDSGAAVDGLQQGMNALVAGGLSLKASENTLQGINKALPVTGAQAETLAGALGVASTAFQFDLEKPSMALDLLDKMTVAGRKGNAELENLSNIFARVGVNGAAAGMSFEQTLAFVEGLSLIERQPERLATLADSTLRLFTNSKYRQDAQKATGVKFFETDGSRRDPLVILAEIKKRMDRMRTDAEREAFLSKAFGEADLDTIKGMRTLLTGDMLSKVGAIQADISKAGGTIDRDLPRALANAVDQSGRLKATLIEAADGFGLRINNVLSAGIKKALDPKSQGGLGLSGGELMAGGAAGLVAAYAGGRVLKGAAGKLLGGTAGLAGGVAMGQALEQAGAATPVFVVGAAPGVFGGAGGVGMPGAVGTAGGAAGGAAAASRVTGLRLFGARAALAGGSTVGSLAGAGAGGLATTAGGVGIAGVGGWAVGSLIHKGITANRYTNAAFEIGSRPGMETLMRTLALLGNKDAKGIVADRERQQKLEATVRIAVSDNRVTATAGPMSYTGGPVRMQTTSAPTGRMMTGSGR